MTAPPTNQSIDVTPGSATLTVSSEPSTTDDREYVIADPTPGVCTCVALFRAGNVTVGLDGDVTFADADADDVADWGGTQAGIATINGSPFFDVEERTAAFPNAGGDIRFVVDGHGADTVVPVAYLDANNNGLLDLGPDDKPLATEPFGVGGITNYILPLQQGLSR